MIAALFGAWMTSRPLQWAVLALLSLGGYEGWKYHQRSIGASKLEARIEQKATADVQKVDEARATVDAGAGRVRNKYERQD
jgi:hypothetical protein